MKHISCYDDTSDLIDAICEELDLTESELVDRLLEDAANDDPEIEEIYKRFYK